MLKSKVKRGVHQEMKDESIDIETAKLLKTQDMAYLVVKKAVDDKKVEKLSSNLHMIGEEKPKSHKIFVDSENEINDFDPVKHFETTPDFIDRNYNRLKESVLTENNVINVENVKDYKKVLRKRSKAYDELQARISRGNKIKKTIDLLQTQRNIMGKGTKRKIKDQSTDGKPAIYKWKRERLR